MKKFSTVLVLVLMALLLVGCSKVNEGYADKVNEAVEEGEALDYTQVIKDLGEAQMGGVTGVEYNLATGSLTWIKGCETVEEAREKVEAGKTVYTLTIVFTANKAVAAHWQEFENPSAE